MSSTESFTPTSLSAQAEVMNEIVQSLTKSSGVSKDSEPKTEKNHVHVEEHAKDHAVVRDIIIGFSDGLTVPFALCAALSSVGSTKFVTLAGVAELFAGAISMGLGGYLACITERDTWHAELTRETEEVETKPEDEMQEIRIIMRKFELPEDLIEHMANYFVTNKKMWIAFMMEFELHLEEPKAWRPAISAASLGLSYLVGGVIPMIPYFVMHNIMSALYTSIGVTVVVLFIFGFIKTYYTSRTVCSSVVGALKTLGIGLAAAGLSYGIVRGIKKAEDVDAYPS